LTLAVSAAWSTNALAALVITAADLGATQTAFAGDVLANDLINDGQSTLASVGVVGYNSSGSSGEIGAPDFVLSDGVHGGDLVGSDPSAAFDGDDTFEVTYTLDVTTNTAGYDLTRILTYAAFANPSRTGQNYDVLVDFVGGGVSFVSLGNFSIADGNVASRLTLENDVNPGVDAFATGVEAIRFSVALSPGNDTLWREFDVVGAATVIPEPSSLSLFFLGAMGIAAARRRTNRK